MKATYINRQGDIEVLTYGDLPEPAPGPKDVLVKVRATALNHLDVFARAGRNGVIINKFPHILGCDVAGEVIETDREVTGFKGGERVLVDYNIRCGVCEACQAGQDQLCADSKDLGVSVNGGYAQFVTVPAINAHPIPDWLSFEEAAAIPLVYKTAWYCLFTRCSLKPGETVLVMAAGSGVGSAAITLCKIIGARVIAAASTDKKLAKARELGADETINYIEDPKYHHKIRELTDGKGVDLIFDSVGASVWDENFECLRPGGRLVNCGVTGGHRVSLRIGQMFARNLIFIGASGGNKADMRAIIRLVWQGRIRGIISQIFPLEAASEAHRAMESRNVFGKLVLQVP